MADLIERDAALEKIETLRRAYILHAPAGIGGMSAICHCRDSVNEIPAVNRWIPCSEQLPERDRMVIVCYYGSDLIMPMQGETVAEAMERIGKIPTVTVGILTEEGWHGADWFPMIVQPTFWMQLPDPPERSEEH